MTSRRPHCGLPGVFARWLAVAALLVATSEASVRAQTAPAESAAPAQNGAPPPGTYPPPPAYPPPGYYPPPPGYYPPPPGYYPPPPGTYPPPPAYPPPGYAAPGAYPVVYAPPPRRARRLIQLIPYIGAHSFQGDGGTILGPGLRFGGLLGVRIGDQVSINGELTIDILNGSHIPLDDSYTEANATLGLSPLVAFPAGRIELAFGPKLAIWGADYYQSSRARGNGGGTYSGTDLGANGAVFAQVGRKLWLGGLTSFDVRSYGKACFTPSGGGLERCSSSNLPSSDKVVAVSALLLFSP